MEPFDAIIDEVLAPGDIIYIPPGFPHDGYSLENALNYSVGFRAPSGKELLSSFADYALANDIGTHRYSDPQLQMRENPADILPAETEAVRDMMLALIREPQQFNQWFGEFISQSRHELDVAPPEPPYQPDEILDALQQGDTLSRLGGLRVLMSGDGVFINGESLHCAHPQALHALANKTLLIASDFADALEDPAFLSQLAGLINSGYWYFSDEQ